MSKKINIAIDGPSGSGKSSTAKALAKKLDMDYLDTGQMYRAITWYWLNHLNSDLKLLEENIKNISISYEDTDLGRQLIINELNPGEELYNKDTVENVSLVAKEKFVREALVGLQQNIAKDKGYILDGRDIGTVVLPDAELKIFLLAPAEIRAERRLAELKSKGIDQDYKDILANLLERDKIDSAREHSPLKKHPNAIEIDTGNYSFEGQVDLIYKFAKQAL